MHGTHPDQIDAARLNLPLIWRETDPAAFNAILNDPEVFDLVSVPGDKAFDCSAIVADPRNVLLMSDGGGILFVQHEPCIYEFHTSFLARARGRHAIDVSKSARRWMFTRTDAVTLLTKVPSFNRAASLAVRRVGFKCEFERKDAWPTKDGKCAIEYYAMHYPQWLWIEQGLRESGKAFHDRLDSEYARHGVSPHEHPEDEPHDVAVGACFEMMRGGQLAKGVILYNRWAVFSGYAPVSLVSQDPAIIDIGEAVLMLDGDTFKVIKCRSRLP